MPETADYALIGDCRTAALVSSAGSIDWYSVPRFDGGSAFGALLDRDAGRCAICPAAASEWQVTRRYLDDTLVLETTFAGPAGTVSLTDCLLFPADEDPPYARRLLRVLEGRQGCGEFTIEVSPRFDYGQVRPWIRRRSTRVHTAIGGNDGLLIWWEGELTEDPAHTLRGRVTIRSGDQLHLLLSYCPPQLLEDEHEPATPEAADDALARTIEQWRDFSSGLRRAGSETDSARRSGLVLKALTHKPTGAMIAAPTTSLPEAEGCGRNWDYRYAWVRDASFASRALADLGAMAEADAFRRFIMRSAAGHADDLQVVYGAGGERRLSLQELALRGYHHSTPVRIGNAAARQRQLDCYGELVNLTWRWHLRGASPGEDEWRFISSLIDGACKQWSEPDHGIWEWPGSPLHFVHSKVLCWSALDRGIRMAEDCGHPAPLNRWRSSRDELRATIEERGFDTRRGVYVQSFGSAAMDAALLLLPTVDYLEWADERMVRTVAAIREELGAGEGLLYRYRRDDGLEGREGAFLCCSFWLVECLARQGEATEARAVYDSAMACANDLGLFAEEVEPEHRAPRGNFPQGLTHLSQIVAALALVEAESSASRGFGDSRRG